MDQSSARLVGFLSPLDAHARVLLNASERGEVGLNSSHHLLQEEDSAALEWQLLFTIREPATIALTVLYALSFLVGFLGNAMSIRVLVGRRAGAQRLSGASATRVLLVNLAVCDLAVVCVCMPVTLGHRIYMAWVYGDFLCRAVPFTQAVSVAASVLSLTVISVNRYYSVRWPLQSRACFTRRRILATVAVVWVVSSAICAPLAFTMRREDIRLIDDLPIMLSICREVWAQPCLRQAYSAVLFSALYCLPVTFNLTIGFLTGRRLWGGGAGGGGGRFSELDPRSRALHAARLRSRKQIARMVVALVLLFAVSWLPLYVTEFWLDMGGPPDWLLQALPFAQWLGLTNSSLNPFCYCFIGDLYRSARTLRSRYNRRMLALFGGPSAFPVVVESGEGASSSVTALALSALPKLVRFSSASSSQPRDLSKMAALSDSCRSLRKDLTKMAAAGDQRRSSRAEEWSTRSYVCETALLPCQPRFPEAVQTRL